MVRIVNSKQYCKIDFNAFHALLSPTGCEGDTLNDVNVLIEVILWGTNLPAKSLFSSWVQAVTSAVEGYKPLLPELPIYKYTCFIGTAK